MHKFQVLFCNVPDTTAEQRRIFAKVCHVTAIALQSTRLRTRIAFVDTVELLEAHLADWDGETLLISNFAPNAAWAGNPELGYSFTMLSVGVRVTSMMSADGYDRSSTVFGQLLAKHPCCESIFITGAPEAVVSDEAIIAIAADRRISVQRKQSWHMSSTPYDVAFERFALAAVQRKVELIKT